MVYAHHFKVHYIVLSILNIVLQGFELYFQIFFPFDYSGKHSSGYFFALGL
jgi:hypothetical protein